MKMKLLLVVLVLFGILSYTSSFRGLQWGSDGWSPVLMQGKVKSFPLFAGKVSRPAASDKIRVQLLADVKDIGKKGEILMVNPAVFMNVLQMKKLAKKVSDVELAAMQAEEKKRLLAIFTAADTYAKELKTITVTISKKIGANSQLFGSVSKKSVLEEIKRLAPTSLVDWTTRGVGIEDIYEDVGDGKRGTAVEDIRKGGKYVVRVRVHADVEPVHIPLTIVQQK